MQCNNCGREIENRAGFCPYCGKPVMNSGGSRSITVGRSSDCNIVKNDPTVSRRHAKVTWVNGVYQIEDLGSANGTFVNGYRKTIAQISERDRITLGNNASLSFSEIQGALGNPAGATPSPSPDPCRPAPGPNPEPYRPTPSSDYGSDEITVGQWIGNMILCGIPILGLILAIAWSGDQRRPSRANWAKVMIFMSILGLVLSVIMLISFLGMLSRF